MLTSFLSGGNISDALACLGEAQDELTRITPQRFCENNSLNVLLSAFAEKAAAHGIHLAVDAAIPKQLPIPDMEFCTILANALENAIRAADAVTGEKQIAVFCHIRQDKLLLSVKNPYSGTVTMADGVPVSSQADHGFGVKSIQSIVSRHRGICTFSAEDGTFVLRVVLPSESGDK